MKRDWMRIECGMDRGYRLACQERGMNCQKATTYECQPIVLSAFNTYNGWTFDKVWRCPSCSKERKDISNAIR